MCIKIKLIGFTQSFRKKLSLVYNLPGDMIPTDLDSGEKVLGKTTSASQLKDMQKAFERQKPFIFS
jgi:hypothetical protein